MKSCAAGDRRRQHGAMQKQSQRKRCKQPVERSGQTNDDEPSVDQVGCLRDAIIGLAGAYLCRVRSRAAGPAANLYSGWRMGRPVARSTRIGSAAAPVLALTINTLAPSGAKCLLPQASSATRTGAKSRARAVGTYS